MLNIGMFQEHHVQATNELVMCEQTSREDIVNQTCRVEVEYVPDEMQGPVFVFVCIFIFGFQSIVTYGIVKSHKLGDLAETKF